MKKQFLDLVFSVMKQNWVHSGVVATAKELFKLYADDEETFDYEMAIAAIEEEIFYNTEMMTIKTCLN